MLLQLQMTRTMRTGGGQTAGRGQTAGGHKKLTDTQCAVPRRIRLLERYDVDQAEEDAKNEIDEEKRSRDADEYLQTPWTSLRWTVPSMAPRTESMYAFAR